MTSHVHLIIGTEGQNKLEDIIRDLKSYTSRQIRKHIEYTQQKSRREWLIWMMKRAGSKASNNRDHQFWLHHNHPIELTGNSMIEQRLDYVHNNPVEAGFVESPADWIYSSALDYEGRMGLIDIYFLD